MLFFSSVLQITTTPPLNSHLLSSALIPLSAPIIPPQNETSTAFGHQPTAMLFVHNKPPLYADCISLRILSSSCCAFFTSEPKADSLFCAIC